MPTGMAAYVGAASGSSVHGEHSTCSDATDKPGHAKATTAHDMYLSDETVRARSALTLRMTWSAPYV